VNSFIRRFLQRGFVVNVSKIVSGMLVGQVSIFLLSPFLTKIYQPEQFGVLGSVQSIVATIWVIATLRYDLALPLVKTKKEANSLLTITLGFSAFFSLSLLVFLFFAIRITDFGGYEYLKEMYWLLPIGVLLIAWFYSLSFYLIGKKQFSAVSMAKGVQGAGMGLGQLLLGLISASSLFLVIGYLLGYLLAILVQIKKGFSSFQSLARRVHSGQSGLLETAKKFKQFPQYSVVSSFANIASTQIPTVLLAIVYSPEIAGFFFLAQRILGMPIDLLATSIAQVYLGESGKIIEENPIKVLKLFKKIVLVMTLIGVLPMLLILWKGEWMFEFIFGEDWRMAGVMAKYLTFMYFTRMILTPLSHTLIVLKKLNIQLGWDILRLVSLLTLFWYFSIVNIPITKFTFWFSLLMGGLYVFHGLLCFYYLMGKAVGAKRVNIS